MSDDEYEIPLRDQRVFGSGLKRKRIQFVSSSKQHDTDICSRTDQEVTAAEKYLAIVLSKRSSSESPEINRQSQKDALQYDNISADKDLPEDESATEQLCEVCSKPVNIQEHGLDHENSLVHQICMKHSHPPSHIDRGRKGLAVLQSYGWDPDRRRGLGAGGGGILHPIKAKENAAKAGLGATLQTIQTVPKPVKLDAGKTRIAEKDALRRKDRLRKAFYQDESVERYLGQLGD